MLLLQPKIFLFSVTERSIGLPLQAARFTLRARALCLPPDAMARTMRAVLLTRFNALDSLHIARDVPVPVCKPHEARFRLREEGARQPLNFC